MLYDSQQPLLQFRNCVWLRTTPITILLKKIIKFKTITSYLDFPMSGSKNCSTGIQGHLNSTRGNLNSSSPGGSPCCWTCVRFKTGFHCPVVFTLIKMKQNPTSQRTNNLRFWWYFNNWTVNKHPFSLGLCNLDTWSQKQFPYRVNKHLPPVIVKSPFITDIRILLPHKPSRGLRRQLGTFHFYSLFL